MSTFSRSLTLVVLALTSFSLPGKALAVDQTACGIISTPGIYTLQNDVSSDATCFTVTSAGVTLDLNGHTVTYDNATPISVPNGSFEDSLPGTWDLANAPSATQDAGSYIEPVSVYDGNYAIRFSLPSSDQYIQTAGSVTLEPNTTYSLSAMFYNGHTLVSNPDGVSMKVELVDSGVSATYTGVTWRGFQYTNSVFTTGSAAGSYHIRVSVAGAFASTGNVYVDDIKIVKARSYAVHVGPGYTNANSLNLANGAIVQGQGGGFGSPALRFEENSGTNQNINNLNITTHGVNSRPIEFTNGTYGFINSRISNNTLNHNGTTIKTRDHMDGAVIYSIASHGTTIDHNIITNGPQGGIIVSQTPNQTPNEISYNHISLKSKYSNGFAIGSGGLVHDNTVNCGTGSYTCRGIYAGGNGVKIYNNNISVQALPNNQEYGTSDSNGGQPGGCMLGGVYGIQSEDDIGSYVTNLEVFGNTVTANSGQCEAYALRTNLLQALSSNNKIYNNSFNAIASGTQRAAALKNSGGTDSRLIINDNTFGSNHRWIYILTEDGEKTGLLTLSGNRWEASGTVAPFYPFETSGIGGALYFVDNLYGVGDELRFTSACFGTTHNLGVCNPNVQYSLVSTGATEIVDTTAPDVTAFTMPAGASSLQVSVTNFTASDNKAVTGYMVTESAVAPASDNPGWSSTANTAFTFVGDGVRTAYAWVKDGAGNVSAAKSATVTITLPDVTPPKVSITSPGNGSVIRGTVTIATSASDNVGVTKVELYRNGVLVASSTVSPYKFSWNTAQQINGTYNLTAKAYDAAGNATTSSSLSVKVYNLLKKKR